MEKRLLWNILLKLLTLEVINAYALVDHLPSPPHCGKSGLSSFQGRIFGGIKTAIDEYPWLGYLESQVILLSKIPIAGGTCTSSIITADFVLTAAHCLYYEYAREYPTLFTQVAQVTLGEWDTRNDPDCDEQNKCAPRSLTVRAKAAYIHSKFTEADPDGIGYDIALIQLQRKIQFTPFIQPICLPLDSKLESYEGLKVIATGWGRYDNNILPSSLKRKALLTISDRRLCDAWYGDNMDFNERTQFCVGGPDGGACQGDSGGPLLLASSRGFFQIGVASLGRQECINITRPGVYIRVDKFIDWISGIVENAAGRSAYVRDTSAWKVMLGKIVRQNKLK